MAVWKKSFEEKLINMHYRQKYEIFGRHSGNTRIRYFDLFEMALCQPETSIATVMQLVRVELWTKM